MEKTHTKIRGKYTNRYRIITCPVGGSGQMKWYRNGFMLPDTKYDAAYKGPGLYRCVLYRKHDIRAVGLINITRNYNRPPYQEDAEDNMAIPQQIDPCKVDTTRHDVEEEADKHGDDKNEGINDGVNGKENILHPDSTPFSNVTIMAHMNDHSMPIAVSISIVSVIAIIIGLIMLVKRRRSYVRVYTLNALLEKNGERNGEKNGDRNGDRITEDNIYE